MFFSEFNNIVESEDWANLIPETGLGRLCGFYNDVETRFKMSKAHKGKDSFIDKNGIAYYIECNDPRVLSGEFISIRKNKPTRKANYIIDGKIKALEINDPRVLSGEFIRPPNRN